MMSHPSIASELGPAADDEREHALADVLAPFPLATPALLVERKLLRRADSKFVLHAERLPELLAWLRRDYAVLRAGARRFAAYHTLYFDTPDLRCFHDHRRGRRPRHKVRIRHYPDRRLSFFELKTKQSELLTDKHRIAIPYLQDTLPAPAHELLVARFPSLAGRLEPQLWTNFRRLTLIGLHTNERVTIDTGLQVGEPGALADIAHVAIVEVKQSPFCTRTPVMAALRGARLHPASASKYCTALAFTRRDLRFNRLLPALRVIERTIEKPRERTRR
jgi:hypothetical protein